VTLVAMIGLFTILRRDYITHHFKTLNKFKYLIRLMVKRSFRTRYRGSVLGVAWSLLNPILTMLVMTMVFSFVFRFDIANFPVYLLSGQIIFSFFSESTSEAMNAIVGNGSILKRIYIPKYVFPVTRVISSIVNLGFAIVAFLVVALVTQVPFHWTILLIPIPILYTFIFCLGVGMLLASMNVFFRDLSYIYGIFITLLNFLTPIFYPVEILPDRVFQLIHLNPLFHYVSYFRSLTLDGVIPGLWPNVLCLGFAVGAFALGLYALMKQEDKYILYL